MKTMKKKQEFKLLKKVLRENGCLRLYRRKIRYIYNMSLLECFESNYLVLYLLDTNNFQGTNREFWEKMNDLLHYAYLNYEMNLQEINNIETDLDNIEPIFEFDLIDIVDDVDPDFVDPFSTDELSHGTTRRVSVENMSPKLFGVFKDSES